MGGLPEHNTILANIGDVDWLTWQGRTCSEDQHIHSTWKLQDWTPTPTTTTSLSGLRAVTVMQTLDVQRLSPQFEHLDLGLTVERDAEVASTPDKLHGELNVVIYLEWPLLLADLKHHNVCAVAQHTGCLTKSGSPYRYTIDGHQAVATLHQSTAIRNTTGLHLANPHTITLAACNHAAYADRSCKLQHSTEQYADRKSTKCTLPSHHQLYHFW